MKGLVEVKRAGRRLAANDENPVKRMLRALSRGPQLVQQGGGDNRAASAAMLKNVGIIVDRQQGIERNGHDPGIKRAQESDRPFAPVFGEQQDAFLTTEPCCNQRSGTAADLLIEGAVTQFAEIIDKGETIRPGRVQLQEMAGEVELFRRMGHQIWQRSLPSVRRRFRG